MTEKKHEEKQNKTSEKAKTDRSTPERVASHAQIMDELYKATIPNRYNLIPAKKGKLLRDKKK